MTDLMLTAAELERLTGRKRPTRQAALLSQWGVEFSVDEFGTVQADRKSAAYFLGVGRTDWPSEPDPIREPIHGSTRRAKVAQRNADLLSINALRNLPSTSPAPHCAGVYFLWRGSELLYIGMAQCLSVRLLQHTKCKRGERTGKRIPFDRHTCLAVAEAEVDATEAAYIRAYLPPFNDQVP